MKIFLNLMLIKNLINFVFLNTLSLFYYEFYESRNFKVNNFITDLVVYIVVDHNIESNIGNKQVYQYNNL